jgi:hypothetical protein
MRNPQTLLAIALAVTAAAATNAQQETMEPRSIRLEFPEATDLTGLSVHYRLVGPPGRSGSVVRVQPDTPTYDIEAWQDGQPGTELKAVVYCPGRGFVRISASGFGSGPAKTLPVQLDTLGWIPLSGKVSAADMQELRIEVTYVAPWINQFLGVSNGIVPMFEFGSAPLESDGAFSLRIPDLASDPIVASYDVADRGQLLFVARELKTGDIAFFLRSQDPALTSPMGLQIAKEYPGVLQFDSGK